MSGPDDTQEERVCIGDVVTIRLCPECMSEHVDLPVTTIEPPRTFDGGDTIWTHAVVCPAVGRAIFLAFDDREKP